MKGLIAGLMLLLMISALGVVYSKHHARKSFVKLNELHQQRDELNTEWGRLQLELSTYTTHGRIERQARQRLQMRVPAHHEIVLVTP